MDIAWDHAYYHLCKCFFSEGLLFSLWMFFVRKSLFPLVTSLSKSMFLVFFLSCSFLHHNLLVLHHFSCVNMLTLADVYFFCVWIIDINYCFFAYADIVIIVIFNPAYLVRSIHVWFFIRCQALLAHVIWLLTFLGIRINNQIRQACFRTTFIFFIF